MPSKRITCTCVQCGQPFLALPDQRFCTPACKSAAQRRHLSPDDIAARLWARVDRSGDCWLWTGYTNPGGYGQMNVGGHRTRLTHRVAWELTYGAIPDGDFVCHRCDTPACCRPDHLFLGSHTDNMRDATQKGRLPRNEQIGEAHKAAKLTADDVRRMRALYAAGGYTFTELGDLFSVSRAKAFQVVRRKSWRHIE
jgi:hypothetical protein